jgi:hypothetical protein
MTVNDKESSGDAWRFLATRAWGGSGGDRVWRFAWKGASVVPTLAEGVWLRQFLNGVGRFYCSLDASRYVDTPVLFPRILRPKRAQKPVTGGQ